MLRVYAHKFKKYARVSKFLLSFAMRAHSECDVLSDVNDLLHNDGET